MRPSLQCNVTHLTLTLPVTLNPAAVSLMQNGQEHEVDAVLRRKFEGRFRDIEIVEREDLDLVRAAREAQVLGLRTGSALDHDPCGEGLQPEPDLQPADSVR